ncbi:unnamed protein product [marine sediment metagenome]|uniref:Uncharacterized protein n=1 Tax=marine sediment metagenome TaxID=412755 RepID=X1PZ06_9ZZZZ
MRFDYRAMFIYLGDNEPLENLYLGFPAPQIENKFAGDIFSSWELYYIEDDNSLTLQTTPVGIVNLRGSRSSQLEIYTSIMENTEYGPSLVWILDRLYSQEVFMDYGWNWVPRGKANVVTLRAYGDPQGEALAYWYTPNAQQENKRIDFSFAVGLYRENTLIERYEVTWENEDLGWYYLSRTI